MTRSRTEIESRLLNWGRWWRDPIRTGELFGHCRSIEHRFMPDKVSEAEHEQEKVRKRALIPDVRDAEIIMAAWKKCSGRTKMLLKWTYAMHEERHIGKICKRCGIMQDPPRYRAFDVALYRAHTEITNVLAPSVGMRTIARNSRSSPTGTPVQSADIAPRAARSSLKEVEEVD